ncbi:hypothetical protein EGR_02560 [Echinococcus granulosus]|uniref:Uncharacterized protein n=1 Tax=Echinococcus granulosus TaxID=6210 RepID=W6UMY7_ECHGR|nr:hypothetical protein EGR_02560 [Echinococcus granulosus]EUB62428.1 hypothetical protein EGR_02560 [Echinococcus granulosus]
MCYSNHSSGKLEYRHLEDLSRWQAPTQIPKTAENWRTIRMTRGLWSRMDEKTVVLT